MLFKNKSNIENDDYQNMPSTSKQLTVDKDVKLAEIEEEDFLKEPNFKSLKSQKQKISEAEQKLKI